MVSHRTETPAATLTQEEPDPRAALEHYFGFAAFRPGQESVIDAVLRGEDVLAIMPTGAGKSICYQLPAFLLPGCTVVISPLVALMKDQLDSLPPELRAQSAVFNSTIERETMDAHLADLVAGRLKLVYVAPERLRQRPFLHALSRAKISRFVIDEAHCISLWGHDFRPDYLFIPAVVETLGHPPVLAMTATATPAIQTELSERFARPLRVLHSGVLRPNLVLEVELLADKEAKLRRLIELCNEERGAGIVYVSSRENAEMLARMLYRQGRIAARHYHAGLESGERAEVQDAFMRGRVRVIVATVAFGMGVDKSDVRFIVHFNPSRSLEAYAQESGRAGRDGKPARCVLFWSPADKTALGRWLRADALSPALLQAVYRAVRQAGREGYVWWPADRLLQAAREQGGEAAKDLDDTTLRVALGALERVGVLRRYCDLPETATVRLRAGTNGTAGQLATALNIAAGNRIALPFFRVAEALETSPSEVEEALLTADDDGELSYHGGGRGLLIELLPHPPDLGARLRGLLDGYDQSQRERLDEIGRYATSRICRTAAIARHFGEAHAGRCGHCDLCLAAPGASGSARPAPVAAPVAQPGRAPADIIIDCVRTLPFPMGRTGVSKLLKGSVGSTVQADRSGQFAALAALPVSTIGREIDALVEAGYLDRDDGEYRLLSVTARGEEKEPSTWPPPRPAASAANAPRRKSASGAMASEPAALDDDDPVIEERFQALRQWRREQIAGTTLPPYTVLSDGTLRELAGRRLTSLTDLGAVKGIGPAKLERYGVTLLALLGEADEG